MKWTRRLRAGIVSTVLLSVGLGAELARAQEPEPKKLGWSDKAELALVVTGGNTQTSTFGFRNLLARVWEKAELHFEVSGLRTETTTVSRNPVGNSSDDFSIQESSTSDLTAESYLARAKLDRQFSARFFAFGSGGWDRNQFAGIGNRYFAAGGVGNIWYDRTGARWRTDYGVSLTREEGTVAEGVTFAGLRFSSDFLRKLGGSTTLTNLSILEENLDDTSDLRVDGLTAVAVSMSQHLSVKVSLQFLFDNVPSFVRAELRSPVTGRPNGILVPVRAEKLDTLFNVALVVDF